MARRKNKDPGEERLHASVKEPPFQVGDYCAANAVRDERLWAQSCPVQLSAGDQVWYIGFRPERDAAARRWWLYEDHRDPCIVVEPPRTIKHRGRSRRAGMSATCSASRQMYRLRSLRGNEFLAPGWTLDYVEPYETKNEEPE